MTKAFYTSTLLLLSFLGVMAQQQEIDFKFNKIATRKAKVNDYAKPGKGLRWNDRVSFFVGAGISEITDEVYEIPTISKSTNNVMIEKAGRLRPDVAMGIVYTPFIYDVKKRIKYRDANGDIQSKYIIEEAPKHFSVALFLNPISAISKSDAIGHTLDLGLGLGWRSNSFAIFATVDFFGIKQPTGHFVRVHEGNDTPYVINGDTQTILDESDTSIFKHQVMSAVGVKIAYIFDLFRNDPI